MLTRGVAIIALLTVCSATAACSTSRSVHGPPGTYHLNTSEFIERNLVRDRADRKWRFTDGASPDELDRIARRFYSLKVPPDGGYMSLNLDGSVDSNLMMLASHPHPGDSWAGTWECRDGEVVVRTWVHWVGDEPVLSTGGYRFQYGRGVLVLLGWTRNVVIWRDGPGYELVLRKAAR